jgi:hypothetical protein
MRAIAIWSVVAVFATVSVCSAAVDLEVETRKQEREKGITKTADTKGPPIKRDDVIGRWVYTPGEHQDGIELQADGTMVLNVSGYKKPVAGNWIYDPDRQLVIYQTLWIKRHYTAAWENGQIVLCLGREVFWRGINLNRPMLSPFDKMVRR